MSKRAVFTDITPLPPGITRESVLQTLHNHLEMIDLQPLVIDRYKCKPPSYATPEEYHAAWYEITDRVSYFPGVKGRVSYNGCFHDLSNGLQTHVYAPLGLDIKTKWTVGGSLPGEPREAVELGLGMPKDGLWLREDTDMRCNVLAVGFVKKTLKKAHATLVARLVEKAHLLEAGAANERLRYSTISGSSIPSGSTSPTIPSSASFAEVQGSPVAAQSYLHAHGHAAGGPYSPYASYQSSDPYGGHSLQVPPYQQDPTYPYSHVYEKYPIAHPGNPKSRPQEVHGHSRGSEAPAELEG